MNDRVIRIFGIFGAIAAIALAGGASLQGF
jgi:hypothetical protein